MTMTPELTPKEHDLAEGARGPAVAMATRIVIEAATLLGAPRLVAIESAHIDGCLYHGDGGVEFAERLVEGDAQVTVPTTLNVGALDLLHPGRVGGDAHRHTMARRLMDAYVTLGCAPTWTCAPYQNGHRPAAGSHVAWGESNAVAFANSVLGARTNRYGDFLDIACALSGRAPYCGLHLDSARRATIVVRTDALSESLKNSDVFYPVLGAWLGRTVGDAVAVLDGLPAPVSEDRLKALGAAAASTGAVALFHVVGVTPEAPTLEAALQGMPPTQTISVTPPEILEAAQALSTVAGTHVDAVALGSPHFSLAEFEQLRAALGTRTLTLPFYVCTARDVVAELDRRGWSEPFAQAGVCIVADTCVVVTPILPPKGGVLMTNSGKFAHYGPGTIGYDVLYASLQECVDSGVAGHAVRHPERWR